MEELCTSSTLSFCPWRTDRTSNAWSLAKPLNWQECMLMRLAGSALNTCLGLAAPAPGLRAKEEVLRMHCQSKSGAAVTEEAGSLRGGPTRPSTTILAAAFVAVLAAGFAVVLAAPLATGLPSRA